MNGESAPVPHGARKAPPAGTFVKAHAFAFSTRHDAVGPASDALWRAEGVSGRQASSRADHFAIVQLSRRSPQDEQRSEKLPAQDLPLARTWLLPGANGPCDAYCV